MTVNKYAYKVCDHHLEHIPVSIDETWSYLDIPYRVSDLGTLEVSFNGNRIPRDLWFLEKNPRSVFPNRYGVRFHTPRRLHYQGFTVSFSTIQSDCLKCKSLGHVFELQVVDAGSIRKVTGATKLIQELVVFVMTSVGSMKHFSWIGTPITSLVGSKLDPRLTPERVRLEIIRAVKKYEETQRGQSRIQQLDPAERLETVVSIRRNPDDEDAVSLVYELIVTNGAGDTLNIPVRMRFS